MTDMDRPTASLIVRMHMALMDEGIPPYDDHQFNDDERRADWDLVTQAARVLLDTPAAQVSDWTPDEWEVEEYRLLSGMPERPDPAADVDDTGAPVGPPAALFTAETLRLVPHGGGAERLVRFPLRLDMEPIVGTVLGAVDEAQYAVGAEVRAWVVVPVGELGAAAEALKPVRDAFAAAATEGGGRFRLEAWSETPPAGWGYVTVHDVGPVEGGLDLDLGELGPDDDGHVVTFFHGRATPTAIDGAQTLYRFQVTQEPPPQPAEAR